MRKLLILTFVAIVCCGSLFAQTEEMSPINIQTEFRIDYVGEAVDGHYQSDRSGFYGKYINIILSGNISNSFSYFYRQRLDKINGEQSFFNATDWLYLAYTTPNKQWSLSAGKLAVGVGGYEYDHAPINLYFNSDYWNNFDCYQFGASVTYTTRSGKDKIMLQACASPLRGRKYDMYAYNAMWLGSHGWFNTIYSLNAIEYTPGKYVYYVALGNEFLFGDVGKLQFDLMNRGVNGKTLLFEDFSIMSKLSFNIGHKFSAFGKVTYDKNSSGLAYNVSVLPGTSITRVGAGLEFYPLPKGNRSVRLHATYCHAFGDSSNPTVALFDNQSLFTVGLTWRVDIVSLAKKIIK